MKIGTTLPVSLSAQQSNKGLMQAVKAVSQVYRLQMFFRESICCCCYCPRWMNIMMLRYIVNPAWMYYTACHDNDTQTLTQISKDKSNLHISTQCENWSHLWPYLMFFISPSLHTIIKCIKGEFPDSSRLAFVYF